MKKLFYLLAGLLLFVSCSNHSENQEVKGVDSLPSNVAPDDEVIVETAKNSSQNNCFLSPHQFLSLIDANRDSLEMLLMPCYSITVNEKGYEGFKRIYSDGKVQIYDAISIPNKVLTYQTNDVERYSWYKNSLKEFGFKLSMETDENSIYSLNEYRMNTSSNVIKGDRVYWIVIFRSS